MNNIHETWCLFSPLVENATPYHALLQSKLNNVAVPFPLVQDWDVNDSYSYFFLFATFQVSLGKSQLVIQRCMWGWGFFFLSLCPKKGLFFISREHHKIPSVTGRKANRFAVPHPHLHPHFSFIPIFHASPGGNTQRESAGARTCL